MKGSDQTSPYASEPISLDGTVYLVIAKPSHVATWLIGPHIDGGSPLDALGGSLLAVTVRRVFGRAPHHVLVQERVGWLRWRTVYDCSFPTFEQAYRHALDKEHELTNGEWAALRPQASTTPGDLPRDHQRSCDAPPCRRRGR
ncbi:hypothetical protein [Mobilicoccus pelagius]|uniref:Uncharacterized protein n=1 Tax=Mobilicoccus pelagius NBRC 104925 TaxID=1089455 RepID=H5UPS7_9MICO|nr:hypothetical protein [Mobilicoccus pelagius]GAB47732.1 hypothetical protein MOPEL_029_00110 [Mobilicoccus pelagius NBRC 104925]